MRATGTLLLVGIAALLLIDDCLSQQPWWRRRQRITGSPRGRGARWDPWGRGTTKGPMPPRWEERRTTPWYVSMSGRTGRPGSSGWYPGMSGRTGAPGPMGEESKWMEMMMNMMRPGGGGSNLAEMQRMMMMMNGFREGMMMSSGMDDMMQKMMMMKMMGGGGMGMDMMRGGRMGGMGMMKHKMMGGGGGGGRDYMQMMMGRGRGGGKAIPLLGYIMLDGSTEDLVRTVMKKNMGYDGKARCAAKKPGGGYCISPGLKLQQKVGKKLVAGKEEKLYPKSEIMEAVNTLVSQVDETSDDAKVLKKALDSGDKPAEYKPYFIEYGNKEGDKQKDENEEEGDKDKGKSKMKWKMSIDRLCPLTRQPLKMVMYGGDKCWVVRPFNSYSFAKCSKCSCGKGGMDWRGKKYKKPWHTKGKRMDWMKSMCQRPNRTDGDLSMGMTPMRPWTMRPYTMRPWTMRPWTMRPWTMRPWTMRPWTMRPWTMRPWSMPPWMRRTPRPWTTPRMPDWMRRTMPPWMRPTMPPWMQPTMPPWMRETMPPWMRETMPPWMKETRRPWMPPTMPPWLRGTRRPWMSYTMKPWMRPTMMPLGQLCANMGPSDGNSTKNDMMRPQRPGRWMDGEGKDKKKWGSFCAPANFVRKPMVVYCPTNGTAHIIRQKIPTSCSCFKFSWKGCIESDQGPGDMEDEGEDNDGDVDDGEDDGLDGEAFGDGDRWTGRAGTGRSDREEP